MVYVYSILGVLVLICVVVFTRRYWDRPKDTVDMMKKFDIIVRKGLSLGTDAKILELRDNFIKVGVKNFSGEKFYMVKQRSGEEFRVIYEQLYDKVYKDLKFDHVYPDSADQNKIIAQFEEEIAAKNVKR